MIKKVNIEAAGEKLTEVFSELQRNNLNNGVVKIDVEGMEQEVLKGIAKALPDNMRITILFENWDEKFDFQSIINCFKGRNTIISKIEIKFPFKPNWPKLLRVLLYLFGNRKSYVKSLASCKNHIGDIILTVA